MQLESIIAMQEVKHSDGIMNDATQVVKHAVGMGSLKRKALRMLLEWDR